ncbi:MAG: ice-binding family protein, partial [Armatimonadota bacterium]
GKITATFTRWMTPATINTTTFTLVRGTTPISGTVGYASGSAVFTPASKLAANTTYTARITTGAKNLAGVALASDHVWSFKTGSTSDTTPPTGLYITPPNGSTRMATNRVLTSFFSEPVDPTTVTPSTLFVKQGNVTVPGLSVCYAMQARRAAFEPSPNYKPCTLYVATATTGITDLSGNHLRKNAVWQFTTGEAPINLRSAARFAVLAYSTVTNTALKTTVNGDLGVSPGTSVTGFLPGIVIGAMHKADPIAAQAKLDLTTAYNAAAAVSPIAYGVSGNLGGRTLYAGLYKSTSSLAISSGDLTLDARGDPNEVFIFQIASTLTTTSGRKIILSGGAKPANIFWQVGSSATLGDTSVFKGTLMAFSSITVKTGATVDGRLLARNGAVTLDGNTVTRP